MYSDSRKKRTPHPLAIIRLVHQRSTVSTWLQAVWDELYHQECDESFRLWYVDAVDYAPPLFSMAISE